MWNDLTDRHKKYAALALLIGALLGVIGSTTAVILIFAGCTGIFGLALGITIKINGNKEDKRYAALMIIAICTILVALVCFAIAIVGLYLHQMGMI